jgi:hypothetical protein
MRNEKGNTNVEYRMLNIECRMLKGNTILSFKFCVLCFMFYSLPLCLVALLPFCCRDGLRLEA